MNETKITAYIAQVPDCMKVVLLLEELNLSYKTVKVDVSKAVQKEDWFLELNPNGRIPVISDVLPDGSNITLFEFGSILQYLVERYDTDHKFSYPKGTPNYYLVNSWLFLQTSGIGPTQGQCIHFTRFAPSKMEYPLHRYQTEARRLYRTLDRHLANSKSGYLVGDRPTIADFAIWPWIQCDFWAGISAEPFPNLTSWDKRMASRPAVQSGRHKPDPHYMRELAQQPELVSKIEKQAGKWILDAQTKASLL